MSYVDQDCALGSSSLLLSSGPWLCTSEDASRVASLLISQALPTITKWSPRPKLRSMSNLNLSRPHLNTSNKLLPANMLPSNNSSNTLLNPLPLLTSLPKARTSNRALILPLEHLTRFKGSKTLDSNTSSPLLLRRHLLSSLILLRVTPSSK